MEHAVRPRRLRVGPGTWAQDRRAVGHRLERSAGGVSPKEGDGGTIDGLAQGVHHVAGRVDVDGEVDRGRLLPGAGLNDPHRRVSVQRVEGRDVRVEASRAGRGPHELPGADDTTAQGDRVVSRTTGAGCGVE